MTTQALPELSATLVADVRALAAAPLPDEVIEVARHCLLDWTGCVLAGAREPLVAKLAAEAIDQGGNPIATVIGQHFRTSPLLAVLVNGAAADALDFSDTNLAMRGHTTPAVVATALAVTEAQGGSGLDLLTAIVAGIEMACRVGRLVNPPYLRKGFHPTGNLAVFGAAAAAAHLKRLTPEQGRQALGLAATQGAGLLASGGTMAKPFHSGKAAMNGLLAANLAGRDYIARPDAIEAADGFIDTHATGAHDGALAACRGQYLILDTIFKSHAACQLTHSTIEAMRDFMREDGVGPDDVVRLDLTVPRWFMSVCNIDNPKTALEAKFSLRGVAAMTLLGDDTCDINAYTAERITRPAIRRLHDKVSVAARDDLQGGTTIAALELANGRRLSRTVDVYQPLGDLPAQREKVSRKFLGLVEPVLGRARAAEVREVIFGMEREEGVDKLLGLVG